MVFMNRMLSFSESFLLFDLIENCSAGSTVTSTKGPSSVMETDSAEQRRNSSCRFPQYLISAMFGVLRAVGTVLRGKY